MATFYASHLASNTTPARTRNPGLCVQTFKYSLVNTNATTNAATVPATNDVLILAKLPKFSTLLGFVMDIPDLGAAAVADVGTYSDPDRFYASVNCNNVAQRLSSFDGAGANTVVTAAQSIADRLPYQVLNTDTTGAITVDDDFRMTFSAGVTSAVNSTIKGFVIYTMDEAYAEAD